MVCTVLFVVAYFALDIKDGDQETIGGLGASNVALGVSLGLALLFIGIGIIQWARKLMADVEIIEYRHPAVSSPADREETLARSTWVSTSPVSAVARWSATPSSARSA